MSSQDQGAMPVGRVQQAILAALVLQTTVNAESQKRAIEP